ncbi:MAG: MBL fold metallo-hydrolase [Clostridiales bacterium]|nr:MBL fold metallo-hydrolase [Clostridiales bacterium]
MLINYLGHSCFAIENQQGKVLVCDPFNESIGYAMRKTKADVVTMSHQHHDHSSQDKLSGKYDIIKTSKIYQGNGFYISNFKSFHDDSKGSRRGENISFIIESDGIKLCHLGDLGHMLGSRQLKLLNDVDIICIPIGGTYTIDHKIVKKLTKKLENKIIIPMHFKTNECKLPIGSLNDYLRTTILHTHKVPNLSITSKTIKSLAPGNYVLDILD